MSSDKLTNKSTESRNYRILNFCFALDLHRGGVPNGIYITLMNLARNSVAGGIVSFGNTKKQRLQNMQTFESLKNAGVELFVGNSTLKNEYGLGAISQYFRFTSFVSKPDLVVIRQIYSISSLIGFIYAKRGNIPHVVVPHGSLMNYDESKSRFLKFIAKKAFVNRMLDGADAIVVTSPIERNQLQPRFVGKSVLIPYGIEKWSRENFLSISTSSTAPHILFSGRFDPKKNLDLVIASLPEILSLYPNLILDIAGSGNPRQVRQIKELAEDLGLQNNIVFHGWIDQIQMATLYANSSVLILPSTNENFAQVITEALSFSIPCIVSKNVGTSYLIDQYGAGQILSEISSAEIAKKVILVLQGNHEDYAISARRAVSEELSWERITLQWLKLAETYSRLD